MRNTLIIIGLALLSFTLSEVTRFVYQGEGLHVEYGKEHGMLHSKYVSYWPNGMKKAEGTMQGNMRFGDWSIYDSTGQLILARNYETGYAWTQLYPITPWLVTSKTMFGKSYSLYVDIKPDSVIHSARFWRFVPYEAQNPIFANSAVLDTLIAMVDRTAIMASPDDEWRVLSTRSEFLEVLNKCSPQHRVIGYRLKEDWYYDAKKQMGIFAIVGICPVLLSENERDSVDLGWFYYDATLRSKLATMFYNPQIKTGYPVGVEQTFFLRCFSGDVYRYTNVKNFTIAQLFSDEISRKKEVQRMEIQPLEWEHDHWIESMK